MTQTSTTRRRVSLGGALAIVAVALVTWTAVAQVDLTKIPTYGKDRFATLSPLKATLGEAVATAEKTASGRADRAALLSDNSTYEVIVHTESGAARIHVDGTTGEVSKNEPFAPFPGDPITGKIESMPSGIKYVILREGDGPKPAGPTATVEVHYAGYLLDGKKFDSSYDRGKTIEFPLNRVIAGWTEGVGDMKVGEKRKLIIPGDLGYGPMGNPRAGIPGNAVLVFDVELVSIPGQ